MERELAEMTGSLEQVAGLEEKEEGRSGLRFMAQRASRTVANCLREY